MENFEEKLIELARKIIDKEKAKIIIEPYKREKGYWFGGGKIRKDKEGRLIITGRYRNFGDSRYGIEVGERGLELAIFVSEDNGKTFKKIKSFIKKYLEVEGKEVLSIEGSSIYFGEKIELYISTEKKRDYPRDFKRFQKEGTGIWEIDVLTGESLEDISPENIRNVLISQDPENLHIKDPVVFDLNNKIYMIFCQHPYCWTCSYSGLAVKENDNFKIISKDILPKGYTWDVAVTRITDRLPVPKIGIFKDLPDISLYFYDGAECIREHPQSEKGVKRPRGYSCEEIGGVAYGFDYEFPRIYRLTKYFPLFFSDQGTGSNRYVSTLFDGEKIYAIWQKSVFDFSQPLFMNVVNIEDIEKILK
ncbi:MAG: exo-alpha-sialidase [Candidatus Omnitrophica bacterium]|nr:exo-alpha-sialidase [Candidatus Omnitrophota bacterium]MCM8803429.1 exo-alpha-sialidase [Candidatus Omnitrophota bacterium]